MSRDEAEENAADEVEIDLAALQAQAMRQIADGIESVAQKVRETDLQAVAQKTTDLARRHPVLFIGAAAALGFAATRFLKARPAGEAGDDDPWSEEDLAGGSDDA